MTLGALLDAVAARHPDGDAVVDLAGGTRLSYAGLARQSRELARGLMALGLEPGDHLALWGPCLPGWLTAMFAAAKAGLVLTNLDTSAEASQLRYLLAQSDCRVLISARGVAGGEFLAVLDELCPGGTPCAELPALEHLVQMEDEAPGMRPWEAVVAAGRELPAGALAGRMAGLDPQDVACLFYTSGTTGAPKGVMNSHAALIATSAASAAAQGLGPADRLCLSVPISHLFGCVCVALAGVTAGSALVMPARAPEPGTILRAISGEGCTAIYGPPTTFIGLWEHPDYPASDLSSLRTGIMAGATCPIEVMKRVVGEMGVERILVGYGQTESSTWISQTSADDPLDLRVSTVGRPIAGVEVKIVDPGSGREVAAGQVGELCARGYNMAGYYKLPAASASSLDQEGWLHTGDLATRDADGYLRIAGRLKEVIRRGGRAILPAEVEEVLFTHPQVVNAQVFGVPHDTLGEEVAAWIKLRPGAGTSIADIRAFLEQRLEAAKLPAHIKFVQSFPMTHLGKIQKFRMAEIYAAELQKENT